MLAGDFYRKLRTINRKLRIYAGNDDSKPAGLYYVEKGEEMVVCGVDKNELPRYTIYDDRGHILKGGWERVLKILLMKKLADRKTIEKHFGRLSGHIPKVPKYVDPFKKHLKSIENEQIYKNGVDERGKAVYNKQGLLEIRDATRS